MFSAMALIVGLTLLAPVVISPLAWLVMWPLTRTGSATPTLVRAAVRVSVRRVASTAAPVIATVGFSALMAGAYATLHAFDVNEERGALPAAVVIVPDGTPGLSDAVPGVSTARCDDPVRGGVDGRAVRLRRTASIRPRRVWTRRPARPGVELPDTTMVVIQSTAEELGWQPGGEVSVGFPDGEFEQVQVLAVRADEVVPGDVLVSRSLVREHDPSALADLTFVDGQPVGELTAVLDRNRREGPTSCGVRERGERLRVGDRPLVFALLVGLSVGYTAIAIANTLMMATADRRRDFATLRMAGATVGQVLRVVAVEAGLVVGVGSLFGLVAALVALVGIVSGLRGYIPETPLVLPAPAVAAVVAACLMLALVASVGPARIAVLCAGRRCRSPTLRTDVTGRPSTDNRATPLFGRR